MGRIATGEILRIWDTLSTSELAIFIAVHGMNSVPSNIYARVYRMQAALDWNGRAESIDENWRRLRWREEHPALPAAPAKLRKTA